MPDFAYKFIELCLIVTADHGPAVSGAHNTIVTARAGKDLVSSLTSGLLTIGDRLVQTDTLRIWLRDSVTNWPSDSLTHGQTHWRAQWFTHSLTHPLTHSMNKFLIIDFQIWGSSRRVSQTVLQRARQRKNSSRVCYRDEKFSQVYPGQFFISTFTLIVSL